MKRLPKIIYVRWDGDKGEEYLLSDVEPDGAEGDPIGTYELKAVGRVKLHPATIEPMKINAFRP